VAATATSLRLNGFRPEPSAESFTARRLAAEVGVVPISSGTPISSSDRKVGTTHCVSVGRTGVRYVI